MRNTEYISCVERYSEMVFRIAFSYFGNKADAEDMMQEVFLKLLHQDQLPGSDEQIKAWLKKCSDDIERIWPGCESRPGFSYISAERAEAHASAFSYTIEISRCKKR